MEDNKEVKQDETMEEVNEETVEEVEAEEVESQEAEEDTLSVVRKLRDDNKKLSNELEALKDRLLRMTAEYDNYRRRTAKEKEGIYADSCVDVLKEIIPSVDNLERALASEGSMDDLKKGIDMTIKGFQSSLNKLGVEEIDTTEGFDPNLHQAVMHIQDENLGANTVAEVFLKGYKKNDKVIRHSVVKVAN